MLVGKLVLATIKSQLYVPTVPKWVISGINKDEKKLRKKRFHTNSDVKKGSGFYLKNTIYCSYLHTATYTNHT